MHGLFLLLLIALPTSCTLVHRGTRLFKAFGTMGSLHVTTITLQTHHPISIITTIISICAIIHHHLPWPYASQ